MRPLHLALYPGIQVLIKKLLLDTEMAEIDIRDGSGLKSLAAAILMQPVAAIPRRHSEIVELILRNFERAKVDSYKIFTVAACLYNFR